MNDLFLDFKFNYNNKQNYVGSNDCFLLGMVKKECNHQWNKIGCDEVDGNFLIFRQNEKVLEVLSDFSASRTAYFYFDNDRFIISTSQEIIIKSLGDFQFNDQIIPWMISSGTIGPKQSWDKKIQLLGPGEKLVFDKTSFSFKIKKYWKPNCQLNIQPTNGEISKHIFYQLEKVKKSYSFDKSWRFLLSGGNDSRMLFPFFGKLIMKSITWGNWDGKGNPPEEFKIAKSLASSEGIDHKFFPIDQSKTDFKKNFSIFLKLSEGRVDHISGYMDGFTLWKKLKLEGINGVIRGDHNFGKSKVVNSSFSRKSIDAALISDLQLPEELLKMIPVQEVPDYFFSNNFENEEVWLSELRYKHRLPHVLAPLNRLKLEFTEVFSPMITFEFNNFIDGLPHKFQQKKFINKNFTRNLYPKIPFSKENLVKSLKDQLSTEDIICLIKEAEEIKNYPQSSLKQLWDYAVKQPIPHAVKSEKSIKNRIVKYLPKSLINILLKKQGKPSLDKKIILLRIAILIHQYLYFSKLVENKK